MGKGEIAHYKQFLLFPQCFQKACFPGASKGVVVWEWVNLDWFKLKVFADYKINLNEKAENWFWKSRTHCGKRRKCLLPAFSPFLRRCFKALNFRFVKSLDCVGKS